MADALAYFITFSCYGNWLHGDARGSVDRKHHRYGDDLVPADDTLKAARQALRNDSPYRLDEPRRQAVLQAIVAITVKRGWELLAAHVRSNHVHAVVHAPATPIERVLNAFKAAATLRLNKSFPAERNRRRWARHGSTRYLFEPDQVAEKVDYTLFGQGEPMQRFPERAAARSE